MNAILHAAVGWPELAFCVLIILVAYTIRGATGFGAGLVGTPLMLVVLPYSVVLPVMATLATVAALGQAIRDFKLVDWRGIRGLAAPTAAGIGLGLWLFTRLHTHFLLKACGAFFISYGLWSMLPRQRGMKLLHARGVALGASALGALAATVFGGMAGPFYIVYLSAFELDKTRFRATISVVMFWLSLLRAGGYGAIGMFDRRVGLLLAVLFPMMGLAMVAGNRWHRRLDERLFRRVVAAILIVSGTLLLVK